VALKKQYYIIFVAREKDGRLRKIPIPMHYAYVFVAAAIVGAFTIAGMAGSYSRMLLKTARFNQVRSQQVALRKDYQQLQQVAQEKEVQAASLGSLASEVAALYGLRQTRVSKTAVATANVPVAAGSEPVFNENEYEQSLTEFSSLRNMALSGDISHAIELGLLSPRDGAGLENLAYTPSLWPVVGPVTSPFGEREDPLNGEGAFHAGIDIAGDYGDAVRATADGTVEKAGFGTGYGREIILDHGHGIETLYAHLSGFAVTEGEQVRRGDVIGYIGMTGRTTGPHLHYEVRVRNVAVNPHRYLRQTERQLARNPKKKPGLSPAFSLVLRLLSRTAREGSAYLPV
jgi:murein DD-endopeptidase MepM/ murein hydrolase activator NlpD